MKPRLQQYLSQMPINWLASEGLRRPITSIRYRFHFISFSDSRSKKVQDCKSEDDDEEEEEEKEERGGELRLN